MNKVYRLFNDLEFLGEFLNVKDLKDAVRRDIDFCRDEYNIIKRPESYVVEYSEDFRFDKLPKNMT